MAASDVLLNKINNHITRFDANRSGELVEVPLHLQLENKPGSLDFTLKISGTQIKTGPLESCLQEADRVELLTRDELKSEFGINL